MAHLNADKVDKLPTSHY